MSRTWRNHFLRVYHSWFEGILSWPWACLETRLAGTKAHLLWPGCGRFLVTRLYLIGCKCCGCDRVRTRPNLFIHLKPVCLCKSFNGWAEELQSLWLRFWLEIAFEAIVVGARSGSQIFLITLQHVLNTGFRWRSSCRRYGLILASMSWLRFLACGDYFYTITTVCRACIAWYGRGKDAWLIVFVNWIDRTDWWLIVAWSRWLLVLLANLGLLLSLVPLGWAFSNLFNVDLIITGANLIVFYTRMDQFWILLPNKLTSLVFFVAKYVVVRRNRRWIGLKRIDHAFVPLIVVLLLLEPFGLLIVLAWARSFVLGSKFATMEAFDPWCKACMRLHKLDAELIQTEALQGLSTLHVSLNLVKSIGNIVTSRA